MEIIYITIIIAINNYYSKIILLYITIKINIIIINNYYNNFNRGNNSYN